MVEASYPRDLLFWKYARRKCQRQRGRLRLEAPRAATLVAVPVAGRSMVDQVVVEIVRSVVELGRNPWSEQSLSTQSRRLGKRLRWA